MTSPQTSERPANAGADRIEDAIRGASGRAALMPYVMGGFPNLATSVQIGLACADGGADLIELGIPYSDPLADGPVIQAAGTVALQNGATFDRILGVCKELSERLPVVIMTYANIMQARGVPTFCAKLVEAGASGVIVPDLPPEEAGELLVEADRVGLALVPLIAPTTPDSRLALVGGRARGFLYPVSVNGITGERSGASAYEAVIDRARSATDVPVALGFGISTGEQARAAADAGADGVIVGSKLVRLAGGEDPVTAVREAVEELARGLDR
ncbi:MAG: tryptophan synthase subunit alpha [Solirubrobacteraceae bacterium]|nr:tryptophan synthase subunit alpha [Solirubrobacteraceae bacterium]